MLFKPPISTFGNLDTSHTDKCAARQGIRVAQRRALAAQAQRSVRRAAQRPDSDAGASTDASLPHCIRNTQLGRSMKLLQRYSSVLLPQGEQPDTLGLVQVMFSWTQTFHHQRSI